MNFPWPDSRCILCGTKGHVTALGNLTKEHIIPEAIGGVLTCNFFCKGCNSQLGGYESSLKEDPALRLALERLKVQIPWLYEKTLKKQTFIGQSELGTIEGSYKTNKSSGEVEFRVKAREQPDGSLVLPNDDAYEAVTKMLRKKGFDGAGIEQAPQQIHEATEDTRVTLAPGLDVLKRTVTRVDPKLDGRRLLVQVNDMGDEILNGAGIGLLKMAFEYLALHIGANIHSSIFDPIREALRKNDASLCKNFVEWKRGPKLEPSYFLVVERAPYIVIQIRLLGELVYRIHFSALSENSTKCPIGAGCRISCF